MDIKINYRGSGLSVILNVEPDDYPDWSGVPYYGAKVIQKLFNQILYIRSLIQFDKSLYYRGKFK